MKNHGRSGLCWCALLIALFSLSSCGGGGGSSNNGGGSGGGTPSPAVQPINPDTLSYSDFYHSDKKLVFQYPENWQLSQSSDFVLQAVDPSVNSGYPSRFVAVRQEEGTAFPYIDIGSDDELISRSSVTFAGMPATRSLYDTEVWVSGVAHEVRALSYEFEFDGFIYGFVYASEREAFNRYSDVAEYLATTFKVGQIIFDNASSATSIANASDGSNFLVLSCAGGNLLGKIIEADRYQGNEFVIQSGNLDGFAGDCNRLDFSPSFDGVNYVVSYMVDNVEDDIPSYSLDLVFKRISTTGQLIDTDPIVVRAGDHYGENRIVRNPASASDGNRTLVVWYEHDWGASPPRVRGAFIEQNGTVGESFPVYEGLTELYTTDEYAEVAPKVAYGNNRYLVVWNPQHRGHRDSGRSLSVYGQLIDLSGNQLLTHSSILNIRNDDGVVRPRFPDVASDGTDWIVSWIEGQLLDGAGRGEAHFSVQAKRVTFDGFVEDADRAGVTVAGAFIVNPGTGSEEELAKEQLDIAYHDGRYYFVWFGWGIEKAISGSTHTLNAGMYIATSNETLFDATEQHVVAGKYVDHRGTFSLANPQVPSLVFSEDRGLITWVGSDLEGWFIE